MPEYKTKQKEIILDCLIKNEDIHLTASEIVANLRESGANIGASTVYRQLDKLVAGGLVRKYIIDENSPACYQYFNDNGQCKEHFHLKCTECGKLIHTDCALLKQISDHMRQSHGFAIDKSKTLLYGICGDCNKKIKYGR